MLSLSSNNVSHFVVNTQKWQLMKNKRKFKFLLTLSALKYLLLKSYNFYYVALSSSDISFPEERYNSSSLAIYNMAMVQPQDLQDILEN